MPEITEAKLIAQEGNTTSSELILNSECARLVTERDRLRKALEFYAPAARYDKKDGWLELDGGATARAALNPE